VLWTYAACAAAVRALVRGDTKKDLVRNGERYARLAIPEYFAVEPLTPRLAGFRLEQAAGPYVPIVPPLGRWESSVLGLGLSMESGRIRFFHGSAPLPEADELIERMGKMVDEIVGREQGLLAELEQERARAEQQRARAEQERARAEQERARAEQQRARAEQQRARAEQQRARAEQERARAEQERAVESAWYRARRAHAGQLVAAHRARRASVKAGAFTRTVNAGGLAEPQRVHATVGFNSRRLHPKPWHSLN
jgi:hypothetical protein